MLNLSTDDLSIVLPVFNEDKNIKNFINSIHKINQKIEIIAVDNNSFDETKIEIKKTKARYFFLKEKGYGNSLRHGLSKTTKKYIATCEPDGTFDVMDILKAFQYLKKYDAAFGTRTNINFIKKGAKMNFLFRYGNIFVAKILQILFTKVQISDVGCTLKLFKKNTYEKIKKNLFVEKSEFQPEFMIQILLLKNIKVIEIPVRYKKRIGYSKITKNYSKTIILALKMIFLILRIRLTRT